MKKHTIYLYCAVPTDIANKDIKRSPIGFLKNKLVRFISYLMWPISHKLLGSYYTYIDKDHTNSGDIALSDAIEIQILEQIDLNNTQIIKIQWGELNNSIISELNSNGNAFIIAGSGYIHFNHKKPGNLNKLLISDQKYFDQITIPMVSMGIGVNYNLILGSNITFKLNKESTEALNKFSNNLSLVGVRDKNALALMNKFRKESFLMLDPAFFLTSNTLLNKQKLPTGNKLRVGLNFALHGDNSFSILNKNFHVIIKALKSFQQQNKCFFYYFQHSNGEQAIVAIMKREGLKIQQVFDGSPQTLLDGYQSMDIHLSQMMHSAILCMSTGTPTLNIGYDIKNISLFSLLGVEEYCLDINIFSYDLFLKKLTKLSENHSNIRSHLLNRKEELHKLNKQFLVQLKAILNK